MPCLRRLVRVVALCAVACCVVGTPAALQAQLVRGTVLDRDGATPAAAVIVLLENGTGQVVARTLSDARGAFRFQLPTPVARYRLRALRVGYAPTDGPTIGPFGNPVEEIPLMPFTLSLAAVALPTVSVRGRDDCRTSSADGQLVARVWEEGRKALMASQLASSDSPLNAEWIEYDRTLDSAGVRVREQSVRTTRSVTTRAFRSAPAESLATHGYVVDRDDGTVYHAPDAEVMLSDAFTNGHCFRLEPPTDSAPEQIGVAFRPVSDNDRRRDITGVLWLDRASSELRRIEYRYTGLPAFVERARPGGTVEFLRLGAGQWMVQRWHVRMPILARRDNQTSVGRRRVLITTSGVVVRALQVSGGEVTRVTQGERTVFRGEGAQLVVQLRSAIGPFVPGHAIGGAFGVLTGTDYTLRTDSVGIGRVEPILPGQYRLQVRTALMDSLGVLAREHDIEVGVDGRLVQMTLPSSTELLRAICSADVVRRAQSFLRGTVRDSSGHAVPSATVRLRAMRNIATAADRVSFSEDVVSTTSDSLGQWRVCGVPRATPLQLRVTSGVGTIDTLFRIAATDALAAADVGLRVSRTASLLLRTYNAEERPLGEVQAVVRTIAGREIAVRTNHRGEATVGDLEPGVATVHLRRVGYVEGTIAAEFVAGSNTLQLSLDPTAPPSLDTVTVRAHRTNDRFTDFETRRANGLATASITREQIERRNPVSLWQMLTRVPSVLVVDSLGFVYARSMRNRNDECWLRVAINGVVQSDGRPDLRTLPAPGEVYGVEVFAGAATIPATMASQGGNELGPRARTGCGLISIWTR
ncbi:carboxypeptidase regulatory-like domain-containing protein [Gemmatimonas sp.]|uniref:carboxypeptidase regulatory-like domain-containing protein n=1 Tax=Gemmatimonas sp. TaxID=1962908 RepID=UPI00286A75C2|nr:carboxypeptidase regulatory-like domain-containing protein [Gemmatimonas sp.]